MVDEVTTPFGFRWFSWSASQGFSLNGAHYWIQGANLHQDHAGWGTGATDAALYRDVKMVKDAGMNFIRGSHYPKAPAFADACDELGLLFWSENAFWGGFGGAGGWPYNGAYPSTSADFDAFDANVLASLTDMIRIHRNHPSIIAWSMGNEDFFSGGPGDRVIALLKKSVALTHQLDPAPAGRPAAIGGAQSKIGSTEPGTLGDIAGYNGDGVGYDNPGIPNMVSEYGADVSSTRPGTYDPGWHNLTVTNGMAAQPAWRSGISRWCMFDYGSNMGGQYTNSGIVDYFRIPKRSYYWYRNAYAKVAPPTWPAAGTPAGLKLTSSTTTLSAVDGTQDAWLLVTVVDASGQGHQQQRARHPHAQVGAGRISHRAKHHLHAARWRDGVRHLHPRRPSSHRVPHLLLRHLRHRGHLAGTDQLERHHHLPGEPAWVEGTTPKVAPRPYQP